MSNFPNRTFLAVAVLVAGTWAYGGIKPIEKHDEGPDLKCRLGQQYITAKQDNFRDANRQRHMSARSEAEVLIDEDFSLMSDGSCEELGEHVTEAYLTDSDPMIDEKWTHTPGWWGIGVYEAGGAAALAYPNYGGCINTPAGNYYGNLHISFKARAREGNETTLVIFCNVLRGGMWYPQTVATQEYATIQSDDLEWHEYEFNYMVDYAGDDAYVQINAVSYSVAGVVIDDLKVERDLNLCTTPTNVLAHSFTKEGFTLEWMPGAENKEYRIDLTEQALVTEDEVSYKEDFEDGCGRMAAEGCSLKESVGVEGSTALELGANGIMSLPDTYSLVTAFKLHIGGTASPDSYGQLKISGVKEGESRAVGYLWLADLPEDGMDLDLIDELGSSQYTSYMLTTRNLEEGEAFYIDNIEWSTAGAYERREAQRDIVATENRIVLTGLNYDSDYLFSIRALNGEIQSEPTALALAIGVAAPEAKEATDIDREGAYTASWEPEGKANAGYQVNNFKVEAYANAEENAPVLVDTFAKAVGEEGQSEYVDADNFDGIADNDGWSYSGNGLMGAGTIGSVRGYLAAPALSLQNNGGKFKVSFTASVYGDENLVVQSGFEIRKEHYDGEWNEDEWCYDPVTKEVSMEFENGTPHHELLIYTEAGGTFLISDFKVTQDVNAGDLRYTQAGTVTVESDVTSVRFTDLSNSDDCHYSYTVRALRDYQGTNYMSDHSDDVTVFLSESGIYGDAFARGEFSVSVEGLEVSVATDGVAALYAADGRMVARAKGYGRAVLTAPAAGMYIIAAPEGMRKVMVK